MSCDTDSNISSCSPIPRAYGSQRQSTRHTWKRSKELTACSSEYPDFLISARLCLPRRGTLTKPTHSRTYPFRSWFPSYGSLVRSPPSLLLLRRQEVTKSRYSTRGNFVEYQHPQTPYDDGHPCSTCEPVARTQVSYDAVSNSLSRYPAASKSSEDGKRK